MLILSFFPINTVHASTLSGELLSRPECTEHIKEKQQMVNQKRSDHQEVLCYRVGTNDTLWKIAEHFLQSGTEWWKITRDDSTTLPNPRQLQIGIVVSVSLDNVGLPLPLQSIRDVEPEKMELLGLDTVNMEPIWEVQYSNVKFLVKGKRIIDGPFTASASIRLIDFSLDGQHLAYRVAPVVDNTAGCFAKHLIVDKKINNVYVCGLDIQLPIFSEKGEFAVRMNDVQDSAGLDKFIVASTFGNGGFYDYSDALQWSGDTLIYRARDGEVWHVVVNNVPLRTYDYVDNVLIDDGNVVFSVRHTDGTWTRETILQTEFPSHHHIHNVREDENTWEHVRLSPDEIFPRIGVGGIHLNPELGISGGFPVSRGFLITNRDISTGEVKTYPAVFPGSTAKSLGLLAGDIILKINGEEVRVIEGEKVSKPIGNNTFQVFTKGSLSEILSRMHLGDEITLLVLRDDLERTFTTTLGSEWTTFYDFKESPID